MSASGFGSKRPLLFLCQTLLFMLAGIEGLFDLQGE